MSSYTIYADGWHVETTVKSSLNGVQSIDFQVPYTNTPFVMGMPDLNNSSNTSYYRFVYDVTTTGYKTNMLAASIFRGRAEGY